MAWPKYFLKAMYIAIAKGLEMTYQRQDTWEEYFTYEAPSGARSRADVLIVWSSKPGHRPFKGLLHTFELNQKS